MCASRLLEEQAVTTIAIKNVLFATDFSETSEAALPYVAALSQRYGSEIHLAHVLPEVRFLRPGVPDSATIGSIYEDAHGNAQQKMRLLDKRLRDFPHRVHLPHGSVSFTISQLVREYEIDLVVAGTHGRTGLGRLILGSVAEEILRRAPCPVLTVGPNVVAARREFGRPSDLPLPEIQVRDILYATDFKQQSGSAVAFAISLAGEFDASLGLLHVIEDYGDRLHERPGPIDVALRKLQELVPEDAGLRHPPEALAQFGLPAESILQTAAERETDLIVLGARMANGHLKAATHLSGAMAHRVIVGASCPVLTIRD